MRVRRVLGAALVRGRSSACAREAPVQGTGVTAAPGRGSTTSPAWVFLAERLQHRGLSDKVAPPTPVTHPQVHIRTGAGRRKWGPAIGKKLTPGQGHGHTA